MRRRGIAVTIALACAILGCGGPVATPAPASEPTPVPTVAPPAGRFAIQVLSVDAAALAVRYASAEILFDDAADQAAKEDGHPGGAPNRVWVRDLQARGTLPIDPDASVTLMSRDAAGNRVPRSATVDILVRVFTAAAPAPGWDNSPYLFVVVEDGRITAIEQPMLP